MGGKHRTYWCMRNVNKILVGNPEEKRLLGCLRCRRDDNIKMELKINRM